MQCRAVRSLAAPPLLSSILQSLPLDAFSSHCPLPHTNLSQHTVLYPTPIYHNILSSTPHQSITTHYTTLHYTTLHYTTLRSAHNTSDFSMRIAKLSMRDRACRFFESSPCKPPRAMDSPLELNTPVVV